MKQILIATHNPAKYQELLTALHEHLPEIKFISLHDRSIYESPKETGATFQENALLKAHYYAVRSGIATIADDGGLSIDALHGEPGIRSNRWLGRSASDEELIDFCLEKMRGIPSTDRGAKFITSLAFFDPVTKTTYTTSAYIEGSIGLQAVSKRMTGYPYRSLFTVKKFHKNYLDLSDKEHREINHRYHAVKHLSQLLNSWYN